MTDTIHRFIFDSEGIRGELVKLSTSSLRMIQGHQYPYFIANLLQQAAAVNVLLATTLKFEGRISIQLQTEGKLKMLVVQTNHDLKYRGIVQYDKQANFSSMSFEDVTKDGQMCITIEPLKGKRYQGIVPLEGENLAQCVESYFKQSEQLRTRIWLYSDHSQVVGLMLQALPDMRSEESFQHVEFLATTLSEEESLSLDSEVILHRLFHQETMTNLAIDKVEFRCACSREKMLNSLVLLADEDIKDILKDEGEVSMTCEFCLDNYSFSEIDIKAHRSIDGNSTQH